MAKKTLKAPPVIFPGKGATEALHTGLYMLESDVVNFGDSSPVTIFTVPANTIVYDVFCEIVVGFVGTSPTLDVGVSGTAGRHLPNADITEATIGFYGNTALRPFRYTADTDLICTIGGTGLSAGQAKFYLLFRPYAKENTSAY